MFKKIWRWFYDWSPFDAGIQVSNLFRPCRHSHIGIGFPNRATKRTVCFDCKQEWLSDYNGLL
jgi:hypothetical protein